ncbi:MAG: rRNA maturation RNase YbeY [Tepidisphaeraceae bacterium]
MQLDFRILAGKPYAAYLRKHLPRVVPHLPWKLNNVSIALVGDKTMADLHVRFMDIAEPTDVLTFELDHDARGRCVAGEVIVCVPEARCAAQRNGTRVEQELLLYCLHGLLHLTGHDDLDDASYRRMHRAEDRILTRIGVGAVFAVNRPIRK